MMLSLRALTLQRLWRLRRRLWLLPFVPRLLPLLVLLRP